MQCKPQKEFSVCLVMYRKHQLQGGFLWVHNAFSLLISTPTVWYSSLLKLRLRHVGLTTTHMHTAMWERVIVCIRNTLGKRKKLCFLILSAMCFREIFYQQASLNVLISFRPLVHKDTLNKWQTLYTQASMQKLSITLNAWNKLWRSIIGGLLLKQFLLVF